MASERNGNGSLGGFGAGHNFRSGSIRSRKLEMLRSLRNAERKICCCNEWAGGPRMVKVESSIEGVVDIPLWFGTAEWNGTWIMCCIDCSID
jgi:hypothetical protein